MLQLTYKRQTCVCALALMLTGVASFNACADIVISGTRVIYPEAAKDVTVNLENRGNKPLLVQSWLDDGRDNVDPQELKLPFIITPPVTRVDARKGQAVRITWLGKAMPKDRESMLWFNVLEVPPKAKSEGAQNLLQLAFRTRIKLFFRPKGLPGSPAEAVNALQWKIKKEAKDIFLVASNQTPWNISIASATFVSSGMTFNVDSHSVKPFSSTEMQISAGTPPTSGTINFTSINDFGGTEQHKVTIK